MRTLFISAVLIAAGSAQKFSALHGYTPVNDIDKVAKIDFDQQQIMDALAESPVNFKVAKEKYMNGGNVPGKTIRSLSTEIGDKEDALALKMVYDGSTSVIGAYSAYWSSNPINGDSAYRCKSGTKVSGCPNYADTIVMAALNNKGDYELETPGGLDAARGQFIKKGTAYHAVWLYSIRKLSEAVHLANDFDTETKLMKDGSKAENTIALAIDEAWAYWTGSQNANLPMTLAKSRGINFNTCDKIPDAILAKFKEAQGYALTDTFDKTKLTKAAMDLVPLMTVPMVQGCLRYANMADGKVMDLAAASADDIPKLSEAHIFCAGIYPQMAAADAKLVRDMLDPTKKQTINAKTISDTLQKNYGIMSIGPAQVGEWRAVDYECETSGASLSAPSLFLAAVATLAAVFGSRRAH
jgi:hypothetical protein